MLDQIKEQNKCIRDLLFTVLETLSGVLVAFAFTFGILFMMMDIKENSERTAVAMEKLAGMTAAAQKTEAKPIAKPTAAPAVKKAAPKTVAKKAAPAKKPAAKKAPAKKPAPKKPAAKKAPAKKK